MGPELTADSQLVQRSSRETIAPPRPSPSLTRTGDATASGMPDNIGVDDRDAALRIGSTALVEFVCMAKHKADRLNADGYTLALRSQLAAYCARGAEQNHEWIRVPPTPLDEITVGKIEDRPPEPGGPRDRMPQHS